MSDTPAVTYDGVEIQYSEDRNRWVFDIDGKERSSESLALAKKAIDAPDRSKSKAIKVPALLKDYNENFKPVVVTSEAESKGYSGQPYFWVLDAKGKRSKEGALYAKTDRNAIEITKLKGLNKQIEALREQHHLILAALDKFTMPKGDA